MKALIIYHGNCLDGFTAAWIAESNLSQVQDTEIVAAFYDEEPPYDKIDDNTQVYIVDFSYPPAVLKEIANSCNKVILLDHHKSAFEQLAGFSHPKVQLTLDANRSGAGIAWTFFNGRVPMPDLVAVVQDRDLWKMEYPHTKAVTETMYAREMTLENWDNLAKTPMEELEVEGGFLLNAKMLDLTKWIASPIIQMIGGWQVPTLNVPAKYSSDAGHMLCKAHPDAPFAATYQDRMTSQGPRRIYSLRSLGFDVSAIAKRYGGGGHNNAAGFSILLDHISPEGPVMDPSPKAILIEDPLEEARILGERMMIALDKAMSQASED